VAVAVYVIVACVLLWPLVNRLRRTRAAAVAVDPHKEDKEKVETR
jgi:hypothetical protein